MKRRLLDYRYHRFRIVAGIVSVKTAYFQGKTAIETRETIII